MELSYVLQSKGSMTGAGFKVPKGLGGLWHLGSRTNGPQDPWNAACSDPAPAGASWVHQAGNSAARSAVLSSALVFTREKRNPELSRRGGNKSRKM